MTRGLVRPTYAATTSFTRARSDDVGPGHGTRRLADVGHGILGFEEVLRWSETGYRSGCESNGWHE